jgi:ribonuclease HI
MDYDSVNTAGIGIVIEFPESVGLENIEIPVGRYERTNIERLELEGIIQGITKIIDIYKDKRELFQSVGQIILFTDRLALSDTNRTNADKIKNWRKNSWKSFENRPIKNNDLLDEVDKLRMKLSNLTHWRVNIRYKPSKYNRRADKIAKKGKAGPLQKREIQKKGLKIGKRKYSGPSVDYRILSVGDEIDIWVFMKDPVGEGWEISADICEGNNIENKISIITDNSVEQQIHRNHYYKVKIKEVLLHHIRIADDKIIEKPPNQAQEPT